MPTSSYVNIRIRRDTAANWASNNPILKVGEPGLETDSRKLKFGDGSSAWNDLPYAGGGVEATVLSESIDDRVASLLVPGSNIQLSYNDENNELTVAVTGVKSTSITTVDLHNGGNQNAQVLAFDDPNYQAVITGPEPDPGNNAQRIIVQGRRGQNGGEGGDVYLWGGDSDSNGGDIKIYAGDADNNNSPGYGGYINIDAGNGYDQGGTLSLSAGASTNAGGNVYVAAGYSQSGQAGSVEIAGGSSSSGNAGNVVVKTNNNTHDWTFNTDGALVLPNGNIIQSQAGQGETNIQIIDNESTFKIYTHANSNAKAWIYGADGNLNIPGNILLNNGTSVATGTYDNGTGGQNGISLNCAVGYELNWQGGHLKSTYDNGSNTANIWCDSPIEFQGSGIDNMQIDASGITYPDGTTQNSANISSANIIDFSTSVSGLIPNGYALEELHNVATSGATNGQFLQYNTTSQIWVPSSSGNFTSLSVNDTNVSLSGHTHDERYYTETEIDTLLSGKQVSGNYASLVDGLVPSSQLPSYVDDVLEYLNFAALPGTGETSKIYVTLDNNKTYRWSGSTYIEISASPGTTDSLVEGSTNLYFTAIRASGAAPVQSVAGRTGTITLSKNDVGLGNVDNTSDANKPISSATQTALDAKLNTSDVNTDLVPGSGIALSYNGTNNSLTINANVVSVAGRTGVVTLTKSDVSLGNIDNTSDANKPISTATQSALDLKAPIANPTFTGTVSGITKTMVDLGNVDNTSDANKPVSTATQSALDLKAPLNCSILSLGSLSGSNAIDFGSDRLLQTITLAGSAVTFTKGSGWPVTNITADIILRITVTSATTITWTIVNDWFNQPASGALSVGTHLFLLRAIGSSIIEGHYIGNKTN